MFKRSETDKRRVIIVDVSHLFFKYAYGGATSLSSTIMVDGVPTRVDTTLPTYTIKQIHRWAQGGYNPTVVCFDGKGCSNSRHAYFVQNHLRSGNIDYKAGRDKQDDKFFEGINITMNLLMQGGVCVLKGDGYEADDLIKASVDRCKIDYPDLPIDVITGDVDLVPLVDDQVSVFLSSRKITYATEKSIEKLHYVQLTPDNYQSYMESLSAFKTLLVPYNTVLLSKILRGDKSDKIIPYMKMTPTKYNQLLINMIEAGEDLSTLCYYDNPVETLCYRGTEEPIPLELIESTPKEQKMIKFSDPPCLTRLLEVLSKYYVPNPKNELDTMEGFLEHVRIVYNGINVNCAYTGLGDAFNRHPAKVKSVTTYSAAQLQQVVSCVMITLPIF